MPKHPDESNIAKEWIEYADADLEYAVVGYAAKNAKLYRMVAFHLQQASEKYLKGFLTYKNIEFPYTHDLASLLHLVDKHVHWIDDIKSIDQLTTFATWRRYPKYDVEIEEGDVAEFFNLVQKLQQLILNEIS